jgi:Papain-like cysteine protease AvrRpt2
MNRRAFVTMAAGFAVVPYARAQNCTINPTGMTICSAEVTISMFIQSIIKQQCPEWCWAASISMIFGFAGHPIDQKQIVAQTYGNVLCLPAGSSRTIGQDLSRTWTDANGDVFTSKVVAAFDPANNILAINNAILINELQNDHPILYCNTHHAMVIYAADYIPTPMGPNIVAVAVADPWPYGPSLHLLSPPELLPFPYGQMTFLATVRHQDTGSSIWTRRRESTRPHIAVIRASHSSQDLLGF